MKYLRHTLDPQGYVTLETDRTQTRIWFLGDGMVRLRTSFSGDFRESSLSLLRTAWEDPYDSLLAGERQRVLPLIPQVDDRDPRHLILSAEGLQVQICRDPFSFSI